MSGLALMPKYCGDFFYEQGIAILSAFGLIKFLMPILLKCIKIRHFTDIREHLHLQTLLQ